MGEPAATIIEQNKVKFLSANVLDVAIGQGTTRLSLQQFGNQLTVSELDAVEGDFHEVTRVLEWIDSKGFYFPKTVYIERRRNGSVIQQITYKFIKYLPSPDKLLVWQGWKENALVKDNSTQKVYRYRAGKLVLDPYFNSEVGWVVSLERVAAILAALGFCMWLIRRIRRHSRMTLSSG
jgi:hypothetical protein